MQILIIVQICMSEGSVTANVKNIPTVGNISRGNNAGRKYCWIESNI